MLIKSKNFNFEAFFSSELFYLDFNNKSTLKIQQQMVNLLKTFFYYFNVNCMQRESNVMHNVFYILKLTEYQNVVHILLVKVYHFSLNLP